MNLSDTETSIGDQLRIYAQVVFEPDDIVEVRFIWPDREAKRKCLSHWFRADELAGSHAASVLEKYNIDGWGVYVGANPRTERGGKKATDVAFAHCLFADLDDQTDVEIVRERLRECGLPEPSLVILSGHGVHVYWRLESPLADLAAWTRLQKNLILLLGCDPVIHDPPRVMRLPGFVNTKPPAAPCFVVEADPIRKWQPNDFPTPPAASSGPRSRNKRGSPTCKGTDSAKHKPLCRNSLEFIVSGASNGERNSRLFKAAADMHGCGYSQAEAEAKLTPPAMQAGLGDEEIRATVESAYSKPRAASRPATSGVARHAAGPHPSANGTATASGASPDSTNGIRGPSPDVIDCWTLGEKDPESGRLVLSSAKTPPTARAYVRDHFSHTLGRTLVCHAGIIMRWVGNRYIEIEDAALRHRLQPWLHNALQPKVNKNGIVTLEGFSCNTNTIKGAVDAVRDHCFLPASTVNPTWLKEGGDLPPPIELLVCRSNTLHIPTGNILKPTPNLFTTSALDFDYIADPEPPEHWTKFLEQLWGDDLESVELLQEWCGYCLTPDTSQHKMLLLCGPRRSGKGTIGRVLRRLIGVTNIVSPMTSSLAGMFGLQPLIGKSLATVSDARFKGEGLSIVTERLLNISGEDSITIDIKHRPSVTMKLPTRFMFMTNELPRFSDASNALVGRMLPLQLQSSFYGKEDKGLLDRLLTELPGILQWSIEGWKRLHQRGRFLLPASSTRLVEELEELSSPVSTFVTEHCVVGVGNRVAVSALYQEWTTWCAANGHDFVTTAATFGRDLAAAFPSVIRRRGANGTNPFYEGIRLNYV